MRKRAIQLIHIAKSQLALEDDIYRNILVELTGKVSCSDMNQAQLDKVLSYFKDNGFKVKKTNRKKPNIVRKKVPEIAMIRAIWLTMAKQGFVRDSSEQALDNYVSRMLNRSKLGENVSFHLQFLSVQQAYKVLEILKNWHKRELIQWMEQHWIVLSLFPRYSNLAHYTASQFDTLPSATGYKRICETLIEATEGAESEIR